MTQNTPDLSHWFVKEEYRAIAEIKYKLKQLESRLNKYLNVDKASLLFPTEVNTLCQAVAHQYLIYLQLIDVNKKIECSELPLPEHSLNWQNQYLLMVHLKQQLNQTANKEIECTIIRKLASLYYHFNKLIRSPMPSNTSSGYSERLKKIFKKNDLLAWLTSMVDFWNEDCIQNMELSGLFHGWNPQQIQAALDYFSDPELVSLVNAMFFYKLYPDKLFKELIHPEKLVSVRMRIGLLHRNIELLENQLYSSALQLGLKPEVDYLFHGDDLPKGIMIEVEEKFREMIQSAIKKVKLKYTHESEEQVTIERLHDLGRAYKFWFNPNRLIDAVMVLQQRLVKDDVSEEYKLLVFHQKMVLLFGQLTTTECLDLYGYFANNDSRYLLYTLFAIDKGQHLDWLPELNGIEKNAITRVFLALQCVMEALCEELKIRHVTTDPYVYDLAKQQIHTGRRNRDAVFRIIAIYGSETVTTNDSVEQLFNIIEDSSQS